MVTREIVLALPEVLYLQLEAAAAETQRNAEEIVVDALSAYLPPLPPDLAAELAGWDTLSDEAFLDFERSLETAA